jgi:hypothetical protein
MLREEAWKELKETIVELRDNNGIGTQQEVCNYLANLMKVLEKQITDRWIPVNEKPPKDGAYHVTRRTNRGNVIGVASYSKDLFTVDEYDFADKKGKGGWYNYDYEDGYYEVTDSITAWRELLEPYVPDINVGKMAESEDKE